MKVSPSKLAVAADPGRGTASSTRVRRVKAIVQAITREALR